MLNYLELTEVKKELESRNIKYKEVRPNNGILLYVNGLMRIDKPTRKQLETFWPNVRVSLHEGDSGYYVRDCGMIMENLTLNRVIDIILREIKD